MISPKNQEAHSKCPGKSINSTKIVKAVKSKCMRNNSNKNKKKTENKKKESE